RARSRQTGPSQDDDRDRGVSGTLAHHGVHGDGCGHDEARRSSDDRGPGDVVSPGTAGVSGGVRSLARSVACANRRVVFVSFGRQPSKGEPPMKISTMFATLAAVLLLATGAKAAG